MANGRVEQMTAIQVTTMGNQRGLFSGGSLEQVTIIQRWSLSKFDCIYFIRRHGKCLNIYQWHLLIYFLNRFFHYSFQRDRNRLNQFNEYNGGNSMSNHPMISPTTSDLSETLHTASPLLVYSILISSYSY